jgi:hypothetical protein
MSTKHRKVRNALSHYRRLAFATCAIGFAFLVTAGALLALVPIHAVALAAMGSLLLATTVPLAARAATLGRQLAQIEAMTLRPAVVPGAAVAVGV